MLIVRPRDVIDELDEATARRIVAQMRQARSQGSDPDADPDLDEEAMVQALVSGRLTLVRLDDSARVLDAPVVRELSSMAPGFDGVPEPPRPDAWVGVQVVDQRGRPLPMFGVELTDPSGRSHSRSLDADATARVDALPEDGPCVVTLLARDEP